MSDILMPGWLSAATANLQAELVKSWPAGHILLALFVIGAAMIVWAQLERRRQPRQPSWRQARFRRYF